MFDLYGGESNVAELDDEPTVAENGMKIDENIAAVDDENKNDVIDFDADEDDDNINNNTSFTEYSQDHNVPEEDTISEDLVEGVNDGLSYILIEGFPWVRNLILCYY